jgi:hypothetical protein
MNNKQTNGSDALIKDGFICVENVLSVKEIKKLRDSVKKYMETCELFSVTYKGKTQPNAAVKIPELSWIFAHPTILSTLRDIFGDTKIMFTSHCDIHSRTLSAWHKDDGMQVTEGGYFEQSSYDSEDCRVYKVGIYLQDHNNNLGGLRIRRGSHRVSSLNEGEEVYLQTKAGDIVIFDVRLTHTGQTEVVPISWLLKPVKVLRRIARKLGVEFNRTDRLLKGLYDRIAGDRLSIFFTFGSANEFTIKFG